MSAGKGNKKVTVKVAGEIQIESVVSAILDRGSDDGEGAKTCSVRKIKDFLIEKRLSEDPEQMNVRLKETLLLAVEGHIIQRPKSQSELRTDLRGSFQLVDAELNNNKPIDDEEASETNEVFDKTVDDPEESQESQESQEEEEEEEEEDLVEQSQEEVDVSISDEEEDIVESEDEASDEQDEEEDEEEEEDVESKIVSPSEDFLKKSKKRPQLGQVESTRQNLAKMALNK